MNLAERIDAHRATVANGGEWIWRPATAVSVPVFGSAESIIPNGDLAGVLFVPIALPTLDGAAIIAALGVSGRVRRAMGPYFGMITAEDEIVAGDWWALALAEPDNSADTPDADPPPDGADAGDPGDNSGDTGDAA